MQPGTLVQAGPGPCWSSELQSLLFPEKPLSGRFQWCPCLVQELLWGPVERGPREMWAVGLGDVQEAGDTLLCTFMWWAPQQGGHSNICLRWGLACELERFTAGEQDRPWDNSYMRYRKSLSYEHKDTTSSPIFQLWLKIWQQDWVPPNFSCLWYNSAFILISLHTHKQADPSNNLVIFWINLVILWMMSPGWALPMPVTLHWL